MHFFPTVRICVCVYIYGWKWQKSMFACIEKPNWDCVNFKLGRIDRSEIRVWISARLSECFFFLPCEGLCRELKERNKKLGKRVSGMLLVWFCFLPACCCSPAGRTGSPGFRVFSVLNWGFDTALTSFIPWAWQHFYCGNPKKDFWRIKCCEALGGPVPSGALTDVNSLAEVFNMNTKLFLHIPVFVFFGTFFTFSPLLLFDIWPDIGDYRLIATSQWPLLYNTNFLSFSN